MEVITKYFQNLSREQLYQFEALKSLYTSWNSKINVISRKDIENLYLHHVLHSLSIAKVINFRTGTKILDLGTGGGFPGIPLSIMFPEAEFKLIDGTKKKILVVQDIIKSINLKNCVAEPMRAEEEHGLFDFIVSRATMTTQELFKITKKNILKTHHNSRPNGIFCLKGGEVSSEIRPFKNIAEKISISDFFSEEWFKNKYVIYVPG